MNSKIKMFVFLVALGFGSSMLFTMIWDNHGHCIERGMMPDFSDKYNCIEFGTPQAFGDTLYLPPLKQIKVGVALADIQCNDGKVVVYKHDRMSAACVTQETEGELIFKRGWAVMRLGLPATDNLPRDLCGTYDGKWITDHKECESISAMQCSLIGGNYNQCDSACRNEPGFPDVACTKNCVQVCSIEFSTLEDIKRNPVVGAFYEKYSDTSEEVRRDHVSYVVENDGYKVRMKLFFDENFTLDYIDFHCYQDKTLLYEVPEEDILHYLENNECGNLSSNLEPVDITHTVNANNQFAVDLYSQVSDSDENIFFSPWSISTAAAIVFEGARGNTADEMQQVFGYPTNDLQRQTEFQYANSALNQKDANYKLDVANALWIQEGFVPHQEYVDVAQNYYDSLVDNVDFNSDGADIINDWVSQNTQEKIKILFPPGPMPGVKLAITNAIYFNGTWAEPFDPDLTVDAPFWINSQESIDVPMMRSKTQFLNYTETESLHVLQLPYNGDKLSMLILLPQQKDGINSLDGQLSVENLSEWQNSLRKSKVVVLMPKFELETDYDLKPLLMNLGMNDAFGPADFSGMSDASLFISAAVHKAFVNVNEKGTEAAAATGFAMAESAPQPITADHPFVFLIQDNTTGNILFIGRVMNPTG